MNKVQKIWRLFAIAAILAGALNLGFTPAIPVQASRLNVGSFTGSAYAQDFDGLANTGTPSWTNDSTLAGWYLLTDATPAITSYLIGNGSTGTTAGFYSFGTTDATERALGAVPTNAFFGSSGVGKGYLGLALQNNTGSAISSLDVSYTGEQWRVQTLTAHNLVFEYKTSAVAPADATAFATATTGWTSVVALTFTSPILSGTAAQLDGNLSANRAVLSSTISGLNIPTDEYLLLRWTDLNDSGSDQIMAIDDLTVSATAAGSTLSIDDVSVAEGDSGTTTASFTVSLSAPAPVGGVSFDIATSDDTATTADGDYVSNSVVGASIAEGNTTYTFDVTVNGDTDVESNETFNVILSNPTGATLADDTGVGTITNDDVPAFGLSINDVAVAEGDSGTSLASFTVTLSNPAPVGGVSFDIATSDDTATTADGDYVSNSVTGASIAEGNTTYTFDVTVNGDTDVESNETFDVTLSNATVAIITDATGVGTITNDDVPPPALSINDATVTEGNSGTVTASFTVSLSSPAPVGGVSFDIATADNTATAGSDYVANAATAATIAEGNSTYTFDVTVNGDTTGEANETFYVNVTNVTGATVSDGQGLGTITNDDLVITPIYTIQGSGSGTSLSGTVTTEGIVVGDYEGGVSPEIRGFYIQDAVGDSNVATSDGVFIYNGSNDNVALGDEVRVTGTVSEYQGQTQISASAITVLSSGNTVTPAEVSLPFASASEPEQYEGMLVHFTQPLYVTEHYLLGRFGQVTLSGTGKLYQPTGIALPGAPAAAVQAANDLNKIILDDASQLQNPDPILFGRGGNPLSASNTLRGGDTVTGLTGVFTYTWGGNSASPNAYRVRPINAMGGGVPNFVAANARPAVAPNVGGSLKVVGMNLLNYFNSFTGCINGIGGTPSDSNCRGADNADEFTRQSDKTVAAIVGMDADVIGIVEMENDGYDASSAIQDLVTKLNAATAPGTYAFVDADALTAKTNALGVDGIKVGLLYKPARVTLVGTTSVLDTVAFVNGGDSAARNRVSLLQAFQENATGEIVLVNVNHLKSKGSACDIPDAGDGQGNCNVVRTNAANELATWIATDPTGTGDPDVVILGDLNSYAKEDPIAALEAAGYTNLGNSFGGADNYSYVFDGQWGYLDYAMGSASLLAHTIDVQEWHINSDEPSVLDYNTEYKTAGQIISLYSPDQYRISDHDPVVVGLAFDNVAPTVDTFTATSPSNSLNIPISAFTASDAVGVTGYLITESASVPGAGDAGWTGSAPATYTVASEGSYTLYPWAKDAAGNVSAVFGSPASVTVDTTAPSVATFIATSPSNSLNIPVTTFTATDDVAVTGYLITESATIPGAGDAGWSGTAPTTYTVASDGNYTLYPWAKDAAGNVSAVFGSPVSIFVDSTDPSVVSIVRVGVNPTNAASVDFTVTFSEAVTDVDIADFELAATGISGASVTGVVDTGNQTSYTVTVDTGTGSGTLRLDIPVTATVNDLSANPLGGLPYTSGESYAVRIQTFADVATSYWAWSWVERLYAAGITGGCGSSPLIYCPDNTVTRAEMAIFLLRGIHGASYTPPAATGTVFNDVPATHWAAAWIEQLLVEGITGGCGTDLYCPENKVTRAEMAIFLLRAEHGSSYTPPAATGTVFTDVPDTYWAAAWIEQLASEGITSGCGANTYCPGNSVTRAEMAVFLVRTFGLP